MSDDRQSRARLAAEALWRKDKKQAAAAVSKKEKEQAASALKMRRLRELRLAKEAAEKVATDTGQAVQRSAISRWGKT